MEFTDVVRARRMVRAYRPDAVDAEVVRRILDTARRAPSAGHSQGQSFVVVTDAARRRALADLCDEDGYVARGFDPWLSVAPVHVIPCVSRAAYEGRYAEPDKSTSRAPGEWDVPFWWVDGGAAMMLLLLAVANEGLAAGFQALPDGPELREIAGLRDDEAPLGLVTIGHAAPDRPSSSLRRGRRAFDEQVRFR
jgi:nitroreductase